MGRLIVNFVAFQVGWFGCVMTAARGLAASEAAPPACSANMAMGAPSYISRSLPLAFFLSAGYANTPPRSSVRWKLFRIG